MSISSSSSSYSATRVISATLIFLASLLVISQVSTSHSKRCVSPTFSYGEEQPTARRTMSRTFREMKTLENLSHEADDAWSTILSTPKGGFLWTTYNETANEAWGISMFHAIHCLGLIRNVVQSHSHGGERVPPNNTSSQSHGHVAMDMGHIGHCFSYIAQVSRSST